MKATFSNTVDILVKAYLKDDLRHNHCNACAVGNIVGGSEWRFLFVTDKETGRQYFYSENDPNYISDDREFYKSGRRKGETLISESGYSIFELAKVELAFETASKEGDRMFNGLMAVVDVLADIHGINLSQKEEAKLLFVKV